MKTTIAGFINGRLRKCGCEIKSTAVLPKRNLLGIKNRYNIYTIIDAGANLGQFARWARAEFPAATIHSFEPVDATFEKLKAEMNGEPRWHAYHLALSSQTCVRDMNVHIDHPSSSSLLESTETESALFPTTLRKVKHEVHCTTLDQWVDDFNPIMKDDILLKMDVQGHEGHVLRGGVKTLQKVKVVIAEAIIEELYYSQTTFSELVKLLENVQFQFVGVLEHGFSAQGDVVSLDAVFMKRPPKFVITTS